MLKKCAVQADSFFLTRFSSTRFSSGACSLPGPGASDVFAELERQLGLRLVNSKAGDKVLVVDRVNLTPTEN